MVRWTGRWVRRVYGLSALLCAAVMLCWIALLLAGAMEQLGLRFFFDVVRTIARSTSDIPVEYIIFGTYASVVARSTMLGFWIRSLSGTGREGRAVVWDFLESLAPVWRRISEFRQRDRLDAAFSRDIGMRTVIECINDFIWLLALPGFPLAKLLGVRFDDTVSFLVAFVLWLLVPAIAVFGAVTDFLMFRRTRNGGDSDHAVGSFD